MRSLNSKITWKKASFNIVSNSNEKPKTNDLKWVLSNLSIVKENAGDKPIFVFIGSKEVYKTSSKSKRPPRPTLQYRATVKAEDSLFKDDRSRLPVAMRLFNCYRLDITSVTAKENPALNSKVAPVVAIYDADGTLVGFYKGYSVIAGSVYRTMQQVMQPKGVNLRQMYVDIFSEEKDLYKAEFTLYNEKVDYGKEKTKYDKLRNKNQPAKDRLARAKKKVDECEAASQKAKASINQIIYKYEKMLKGVQES